MFEAPGVWDPKRHPQLVQRINRGQLEIFPYNEWYLKKNGFDQQRVIDELLRKLTEAGTNGYDGFRISGDTSFLENTKIDEFSEYERQINSIIDHYNILAICSYPVDVLDIINKEHFDVVLLDIKMPELNGSELPPMTIPLVKLHSYS